MPFPSGNRDSEKFDRPDDVVIDRQRNRHFAFGIGIHRCLGSNLARQEMQVAIGMWLERFPRFALAPGSGDRLRAHLAERARAPESGVWVADAGGDLLGFCVAAVSQRPAFFEETERLEIEGVYVRPQERRRGLARRLVEGVLDALDPQGRRRVELAVARGNGEGHAFWRALGFTPVMDVLERRR